MYKKALLTTVGLGALFAAGPALAQTANVQSQIQSLQKQIRQQQQQLEQQQQQLKALLDQMNASQTQARQAQDAAKAATAKVDTMAAQVAKAQAGTARATMSPTHQVGWESADGRNAIGFHGTIHYDIGAAGYKPDSSATKVRSVLTGTNMRRLELGFSARIEEDWLAQMSYEVVTGSGDSFADAKKGFNTAKITYAGFKGVRFETGYQNPPLTLDDAFGHENYIFDEHPAPQSVTNIAGGTGRGTPFGFRSGNGRYFAAAYLTTYKSGSDHTVRAPWNVGARATYHVWQAGDDHLQLGAQYMRTLQPSGNSISLSYWPEYRLDSSKPLNVSLGTATTRVDESDHEGLEAALSWKSFWLGGEYYFLNVDRQNLGGNNFQGYYVQAAYVLTGERRRYNPWSAGYGKPIPLHPVSMSRGGWGAWEVAVRWSSMDLNDHWSLGTTDPRAVNGGRMDNIVLGLNWYPTANNKFQLNLIHGGVYDTYSTARGNPSLGSKWNEVLLRAGIAF